MPFELIACAILAALASKFSKAIAIHYGAFLGANLLFLGYEFADSSLLALAFASLAIIDILLAISSGRRVLFVSAAASLALSFESIGNGDWLLNHSVYLSVATNALILGSLVKECAAWMRGKSAP